MAAKQKRLAVFASGDGSDFQSIIDGIEAGRINAKIVALVASKADIGAVTRACRHGIPVAVYAKRDYENTIVMFDAVTAFLKALHVDYIVLAGYLTILTPNIVSAFRNQIINIHPSLIPKYCGDGYYGLRVHQAVIDNQEQKSGATVHFVDEGTDTGAIIAKGEVPVFASDTAQTLQARVLELEHRLLPETIAMLCEK